MENQEDLILDIKPAQERYFGGPGKILLPSRATVAARIDQIPPGSVLTTDRLRHELADQFGVQGTCPVTTKKALQALAANPGASVPIWRVVKQKGDLLAYFPGGQAAQAVLLRAEGVEIALKGKALRVVKLNERL